MSLDVAWTISIGTLALPTDFSDRCTGVLIKQPLGFMQPSAHSCSITLDNFDGALTPGAGGTYSAVNWFEQGIFITCTVNGTDTAQVFHGIVDDFDLVDDGVTSYVRIGGSDWLTILARTYTNQSLSSSVLPYIWHERIWATSVDATRQFIAGPPNVLPKLGKDVGDNAFEIPAYGARTANVYAPGTVYLGDYWNASAALQDIYIGNHQAGVPSVIWPTIIAPYTFTGVDYAMYEFVIVGDSLSRVDANATEFVFTEGTPAAGELPLGNLDRGFNIDNVYNDVKITSVFTTNTQKSEVVTSKRAIGARSLYASTSSMTDDADVQRMADNITSRFSNVHFMARTIKLDSAQFADTNSASKEELAQLLDVRYGLWQQATVTYTPTGAGSPTTDNCVISGRTIQATPGRTTITLDLLPAQDYQSFVLDSSTLGVLDTNRLG